MTLKEGDVVNWRGDDYELDSYSAATNCYWFKELKSKAFLLWSQEFIDKEMKDNKMTLKIRTQSNCNHRFENKPLFRFFHKTCYLCGKSEGAVDMMKEKK